MPLTRIKSGDIGVLPENNYLSSSISNWRTYSDAAATSPGDGIGGSPTITFVQDSSAPLNYSGDFRFTNTGGVSRQGQGVSVDFEIENRHKAKILQIVLDYELVSGTLASNDLRLYIIQDPTGTPVVIEPVNTGLQTLIVDSSLKHIATFQTHVSIKNYRLCIHIGSTGTNGYIVDFANFKIGESAQSMGAVITDWQSFTMTIGATTTAPTKATTPNIDKAYWRRNGTNMEITWSYHSSTGTGQAVGSGTYLFNLPSGYSIDSNKINVGTTAMTGVCGVLSHASDTDPLAGHVFAYSSTQLVGYVGDEGSSYNPVSSSFAALVSSTARTYSLQASIPIAGWGSSVAMSSDSGDGRIVSAIYKNLVGSLITQY